MGQGGMGKRGGRGLGGGEVEGGGDGRGGRWLGGGEGDGGEGGQAKAKGRRSGRCSQETALRSPHPRSHSGGGRTRAVKARLTLAFAEGLEHGCRAVAGMAPCGLRGRWKQRRRGGAGEGGVGRVPGLRLSGGVVGCSVREIGAGRASVVLQASGPWRS